MLYQHAVDFMALRDQHRTRVCQECAVQMALQIRQPLCFCQGYLGRSQPVQARQNVKMVCGEDRAGRVHAGAGADAGAIAGRAQFRDMTP